MVHVGGVDKHFGVCAFLEQRSTLRLVLRLYVEVDEAPFFEEGMDTYNSASVARQMAAAS